MFLLCGPGAGSSASSSAAGGDEELCDVLGARRAACWLPCPASLPGFILCDWSERFKRLVLAVLELFPLSLSHSFAFEMRASPDSLQTRSTCLDANVVIGLKPPVCV